MGLLMIGQTGEDYLKLVYQLSLDHQVVTRSLIAEQFQVSAAAVTKMIKRLKELKLLASENGQGLCLTPAGKKVALEVVRHHRLLELYLYEALDYTWDQVHEEAERLEHVISKRFVDKIDALLGHPTHDPHGAPIPGKNGEIETVRYPSLDDLEPGQEAIIQRVAKDDASMLRYMGELGLYLGTEVKLVSKEPYGGPIYLLVDGRQCAIGAELAGNVLVVLKENVP